MARVLLIEDNPEQSEIYSKLLYYNGFETDCATTAEEGLLIVEARPPDVILVDVGLPGIDGLLATTLFKHTPSTESIPVICFSAYDVPPGAIRRAGADDFLRKPLTGDVMVRAIRRLIGWHDEQLPSEPA